MRKGQLRQNKPKECYGPERSDGVRERQNKKKRNVGGGGGGFRSRKMATTRVKMMLLILSKEGQERKEKVGEGKMSPLRENMQGCLV